MTREVTLGKPVTELRHSVIKSRPVCLLRVGNDTVPISMCRTVPSIFLIGIECGRHLASHVDEVRLSVSQIAVKRI